MLFGIRYSFYILSAISSFVLFFILHQRGKIVFEVLGYINPNWKNNSWCRFFEAIIFAILGALLATVFVQPSNEQQAIFAGMGWTGLFNAISAKEENIEKK